MDNEYQNVYEVDLAILDAVKNGGGGGGGGITSGQVQTMINSALTDYSTTSETEGIVDSALTDYSTTQEVEAMIAASGGSAGKIFVEVPYSNDYSSTTIADLYADAHALYQSGLSVNRVFEKYDIVLSDGIRQAMPCVFLKYQEGWDRVNVVFANLENQLMMMYGNLYSDGHVDFTSLDYIGQKADYAYQKANDMVEGVGIGFIETITQSEYDDLEEKEPTTLYIIVPDGE